MPPPGVEPGLRPSEGRVRIRHTPGAVRKGRAEGEGFEPSCPRGATSLAMRPGKPYPATFRCCAGSLRVDSRGLEPRFPGCRPGVFPLDQPPFDATRAPRSSRRESNPHFLFVREASWPLDHGTHRIPRQRSIARVGVEPTGTRLSTWPLCQFAYRAEEKIPGPGLDPGGRPYESRPGTRHAWAESWISMKTGTAEQPERESNPPLHLERVVSWPIDDRAVDLDRGVVSRGSSASSRS